MSENARDDRKTKYQRSVTDGRTIDVGWETVPVPQDGEMFPATRKSEPASQLFPAINMAPLIWRDLP